MEQTRLKTCLAFYVREWPSLSSWGLVPWVLECCPSQAGLGDILWPLTIQCSLKGVAGKVVCQLLHVCVPVHARGYMRVSCYIQLYILASCSVGCHAGCFSAPQTCPTHACFEADRPWSHSLASLCSDEVFSERPPLTVLPVKAATTSSHSLSCFFFLCNTCDLLFLPL